MPGSSEFNNHDALNHKSNSFDKHAVDMRTYFAQRIFGIPCNDVEVTVQSETCHHEVTQPYMVLDSMLKWNI